MSRPGLLSRSIGNNAFSGQTEAASAVLATADRAVRSRLAPPMGGGAKGLAAPIN
jgi:hypothetical protein